MLFSLAVLNLASFSFLFLSFVQMYSKKVPPLLCLSAQDAGLDALAEVISRQKIMGQEIGNELDEQNGKVICLCICVLGVRVCAFWFIKFQTRCIPN